MEHLCFVYILRWFCHNCQDIKDIRMKWKKQKKHTVIRIFFTKKYHNLTVLKFELYKYNVKIV